MGPTLYEVVGGSDKGGIVVRAGRDLKSDQFPDRLSTGSRVAELQLVEDRVQYRLVSGSGPPSGWISLKLKDKDLIRPVAEAAAELPLGDQQFYSGVPQQPCLERVPFGGLDLWRPCRFPLAELETLHEDLIGMLMQPSGVHLRFKSDTTSLLLTFRFFDSHVLHGRWAGERNGQTDGEPSQIGNDPVSTIFKFDAFVDGEFWERGDNDPVVRGMDPHSLEKLMLERTPKPIKDPFSGFFFAMSSPEVMGLSSKVNALRKGNDFPFDRRMGVAFQGLPAGDKLLEVYLPHDNSVLMESLQLDAGATFGAALDDRPVWITYGSSISHGVPFANGPSSVWPVVASRLADVRLQTLGVGGQCHGDQAVARFIRDQPHVDCISVKFGINVHNLGSLSERTFADVLLGFLLTVRDGHPTTPLVVLSAVHGGWREDEGMALAPSLKAMREHVEMVVKTLQRRGDKNLHYISGLELLGEADLERMPDELHPGGDAHEIMGHRFARLAFGEEGVLLPGRVRGRDMLDFKPPLRPKQSS